MRKENKQPDIADNQICIDDYLYSGRKGHIDLENSESDSEKVLMQNEERRSWMRKAMKKWNYETHQYEEYKVPSD